MQPLATAPRIICKSKHIPLRIAYPVRALVTAAASPRDAHAADVLIIGGGPVGLSVAFHLAKLRGGDGRGIFIVEKDPTYARASATLSAGGIRQQFSLRENVQMSLYGRDFLRQADDLLGQEVDLQFQENGYLFLASTDEGVAQMRKHHEVQTSAGATDLKLLDQAKLKETFPWLNVDDIKLGSFGTKGEGWFDPWALIRGLKGKCMEMGVEYVHGQPASVQRNIETGRVISVDVERSLNDIVTYSVGRVVNTAGAFSRNVMELLSSGIPLKNTLDIHPRKRCIFFFHCSASTGVPAIAPLTVDPLSGAYFRSEGTTGSGNFLCGISPPEDSDLDCADEACFEVDHHLFEDILWPALYHRVPCFGEIKVKSSWAGLYETNVIDHNGIIGFHPELPNVLMVTGFSGHGLQHSPAAGRAGAELLETGKFQSLDLSLLGFERFLNGGKPVYEEGIV